MRNRWLDWTPVIHHVGAIFWRASTPWLGGLGILAFARGPAHHLFSSETR